MGKSNAIMKWVGVGEVILHMGVGGASGVFCLGAYNCIIHSRAANGFSFRKESCGLTNLAA